MSKHDPWEGYRPQSSKKWDPDNPPEVIDLLHPPDGIPKEILLALWGEEEAEEEEEESEGKEGQ